MVRVKICGVTSVAEARLAERCGADAIGILVGRVHRAADFVSEAVAARICRALSPFVTPVVVTHLATLPALARLARAIPCRALQLHSDVGPGLVRRLRRQLPGTRIIGKVSVEDASAIVRAVRLAPHVDALVLDSVDRAAGRVGGTGVVHDWAISAAIVRRAPVPVVLAGGLTAGNVRAAIAAVRPWAVDVNSGVETRAGRKSERLVRAFITAARS